MNKKFIVLAVAAAVSAPAIALADDSTVTLYGTLNVDFENVKADGGTATALPRRNRVSSNSSNIGFRGVEPLGGGLDAWFQVESGVSLDTGASSASAGSWATRNSAVGLKGNTWGTFLLGQWDTPYKVSTLRLDPFGDTTIAAYTGIVGGNSTSTTANVANRFLFDRRQSNSVQYWTPSFAGLSIRAGYGANEEKTTTLNPSLASVSIAYDKGPIYVGGAYEEHKDYGTAGSKDKGGKIFAGFKFGPITLGVLSERLKYEGFAAATSSFKGTVNASTSPLGSGLEITSHYASLGWQFGPNNLAFAYGWDQKVKINGSDDSNAKARQYSVRYAYDLSKRTQFYAMATKIDNKSNSANVFGLNPIVTPGAAGQDPQGIGVGLRHVF